MFGRRRQEVEGARKGFPFAKKVKDLINKRRFYKITHPKILYVKYKNDGVGRFLVIYILSKQNLLLKSEYSNIIWRRLRIVN